jgi:predicted nucleic acid-binding protein
MSAIDTSVAVAAFATWHATHAAARNAVSGKARLIAHVALETYAVLTRLPPPHRAPGDLVIQFLLKNFDKRWLALSPARHQALLESLTGSGIVGGAAYDALVASTAAASGETLLTLDRRALRTYEAMGAKVRLLP